MNLVLVDLDDALNAAGFTVVRYADDIVVVGESKEELEDAARFLPTNTQELQHATRRR